MEKIVRKRYELIKPLQVRDACSVYLTKEGVLKVSIKRAQYFTEVEALKTLAGPWVPKLLDNYIHKKYYIILTEYIVGHKLSYYKESNKDIEWWRDIFWQLVYFCKFLEDQKILHNDLWDDNIIVRKNKIVVIDWEYAHDYSGKTPISSPIILGNDTKTKKELGWSKRWHTGGDLNQIIGILLPRLPYRAYLKKHVICKPKARFPCTITGNNIYFKPDRLIAKLGGSEKTNDIRLDTSN